MLMSGLLAALIPCGAEETRPVLDLDADLGVTVDADGKVSAWRNQIENFAAKDFVFRDEGRAEKGSGKPALSGERVELGGHKAMVFRQQELVCMDADAFDSLSTGSGCTWIAVISFFKQRVGEPGVNSFFGNLRNGENYEGIWGNADDGNRLWWGARNGFSFGRFDENNPKISGPVMKEGKFYLVAGRMSAGTERAKLELFVNNATALASGEIRVNPKANPEQLAIGQERDATNHPGRESFDGEIARFLIYDKPLDDAALAKRMEALLKQYKIKP